MFRDGYDHSVWSEIEEKLTNKAESTDKEESEDFPAMPPTEGNEEEVKEGKGSKLLTTNKLLTRLPIY